MKRLPTRDAVVGLVALALIMIVAALTNRPEAPDAATHGSDDFSFGGYRGWYDLLAREGLHPIRFRRHHDALSLEGIDTLIVAFPESAGAALWSAAERDALRAWVRGGGRLIDIGETPAVGDDARYDPITGFEAKHAGGRLRGPWSAQVGTLEQLGPERLRTAKKTHAQTLLADRGGTIVLRYRSARGDVVSIVDASLFENRRLAHGDDARLAYLAAAPRRRGGVVAFDEAVRGDVAERPWYQALTVPELVALGFAAAAGLLWLLYGLFPLGPPVAGSPPREPTSAEFVEAYAALYGRARARDHARDALVADGRRRLERVPRTRTTAALGERLAAEAASSAVTDRDLVAVARLARTIRMETRTMSPDSSSARARRRSARRSFGTGA